MVNRKEHILAARTTVDLGLQKAAEQSLQQTLTQYGRARSFDQGALVSMEPDGAVRALVGGKDYGESQFNRATHAFASLAPPSRATSISPLSRTATSRPRRSATVRVSCGRWSPKNYSGGYRGRMTLAHGAGQVDQHHRGEALPRCRPRQGARQPQQDRHHASQEDLLASRLAITA